MGAFPFLNGEEKMMPLHTLVKMNEVYVPQYICPNQRCRPQVVAGMIVEQVFQ